MIIKKQVRKYIAKQSGMQKDALQALIRNYPAVDADRVKTYDGKVRARAGKFRIIFQNDPDGSVTAIMAGVRGDIYKHLRSRTQRIDRMRASNCFRDSAELEPNFAALSIRQNS